MRCRLTTPHECVKLASLPDSCLDLVRTVDEDDQFVFKAVNTGVPLRTANDIYDQVAEILKLHNSVTGAYMYAASLNPDPIDDPTVPTIQCHCEVHRVWQASSVENALYGMSPSSPGFLEGAHSWVRSMLVDSECDHALGFTDLAKYLWNKRRAKVNIQTASGELTPASTSGTLQAYAVGSTDLNDPHTETHTRFSDEVITVPSLNKELLSLDSFYRDKGYDIHFRQPPGWSGMEKGDHKVPFRYDWTDAGWYMDYIPIPPDDQKLSPKNKSRARKAYSAVLTAEHDELRDALSRENAYKANCHCYSTSVARKIH